MFDKSIAVVSHFPSVSHFPLQIYRCVQINSVLFSSSWSSLLVVISIDLLMRRRLCSKLYGGRSQLLFALQQSSIDNELFAQNRDLCLPI